MIRTRAHTEPARDRAGTGRYALVLGTAVLCYAALGTVLGILPSYVHTLGGGAVLVGLAVGAPALTGAAGRPLGGRLADRVGPARIMIAGAVVMTIGTLPAFVRALPLLIASRLLVGAGEAAMMAATVLWLLRLAGPERRGRAMGHVGLANYAGLTVGPPLSELLSGDAHPDARVDRGGDPAAARRRAGRDHRPQHGGAGRSRRRARDEKTSRSRQSRPAHGA